MSIPTRVLSLLLTTGLSPALLHAQGCPAPSFLNINQIRTGNGGNPPSGNALIRQPDGSYAGYRGTGRPPSFTFNAILPNYQQSLYACSAIANRPHAPVPGRPNFLDSLAGISGRNPLIVDLLGNSTSLSGFGVDYLSNLQNGVSLAVANLDGSLRSVTNYPSGTRPERMVVADFNGDTHRDLAIINVPFNGNGSIAVFLGNGTSTLPAAVVYATGPLPLAITAADFNSDNRPDIAIIDSRTGSFDRYISVYINNGNGTFRDPVSTLAPGGGLDLIAADFTGDGRVDLAVGGSPLSVFPGNPDGTFRPPLLSPIPVGSFYIAAGDFNKDGRLDIAASEGPTDAITIHLNSGGGLFTTRRSYSMGDPNGSSEPHLIVTDFDGDTWPDVVVGGGHPDAIVANLYSETLVRVLINRGDGTGSFFGAPLFPVDNLLAAADFNQDGKVDAVSSSNIGISFLSGTGAGFQTGIPLAVRTHQGFNQSASAGIAADFNGDSKLDLAVYNGAIGVLLGAGNGSFTQSTASITTTSSVSAFAAGDLNGDSKVDLIAALTATSGPKPTQVVILLGNGDGTFQSATPFTVCSNPSGLRLANLNADAHLDLIATCSGTLFDNADMGGIGVALGNGNGTFQTVSVLPAGANPSDTTVADITGDNRPELFSSTVVAGQLGAYRIAVHLNQGNGTFQAPTFLNTDFGPSALVVTDFSGDGKADILAGHCCGSTDIGLYLGNGNGTFQNETFTGLGEATMLVPSDFNNDGKMDLLVARSANAGIVMLFNLAGTLPVEACTFTLSRNSAVAPSGADAFGVIVRPSNPTCTWTASSPDSWITVSADQRTGPGTALVRVAANPTAAFRTGSATIAGLPITINQYPTVAGCTFALNPTSFSFDGESNFAGITITTGAGCQWTSYSSAIWLSTTASGTGSNNFASLFASQNGSGSSRAGVLDVGGARIQVIQRAFNAAQVFNDVALADPFFGHISLMRDRAITSGCTAATYCPSDITNRGQMAVFLIRAILGSENFNFPAAPFFTDVPATHPFFRYIQKLRELNVTTGCTASTYCPDDPVTRGQMAAFLIRASLGITPADVFPFPAGAFFTDVPANHPFFSFIQLMRGRGITSGCTANTYCPNDPVTRGQMAVFLVRGLIAQ